MARRVRRLKKDLLTSSHQWVTLVGAPLLVLFFSWVAYTFDKMRTDLTSVKITVGFMSQDIGKHTTELQNIEAQLLTERTKTP